MNVEKRKERQAFISQRHKAKKRGIAFLLTFEEWKQIWETSGCYHLRGRGSLKYCMARHNDTGPYAVGNVSIITNAQNLYIGNKDRWQGKILTDETKNKIKNARKKQSNVGCDKTIHICQYCQKQIRSKGNLTQHLRSKHA